MAETKTKLIFGHPVGLYMLFFTELWERFSYYGMRAILVLFLTEQTTSAFPGLGWSNSDALLLYSTYIAAVYIASIPGGYLADKFFGQKKATLYGGFLLCLGHLILVFQDIYAFYIGLIFIVMGVGLLKPNISTMVGGLYKDNDKRRDIGFTIFYIGINIGGFLGPILVASIASVYGWHYGFGIAGLGMLLGQIVYVYGLKHFKHIPSTIKKQTKEEKKLELPLTKIEKDRIIILLLSFLIVIIFWGAFEQAGGLMNLYAREKIDRNIFGVEIDTAFFQSVNSLYILLLGLPVAFIWQWLKNRKKESSSLFKMIIGTLIMGFGFVFLTIASAETSAQPFGKGMVVWLLLAYLFHTIGELSLSPVILSYITKLSPKRYSSRMMGVYWAAVGVGGFLAGMVGQSAQLVQPKAQVSKMFVQHDININQNTPITFEGFAYLNNEEVILQSKENSFDRQSFLIYEFDSIQDKIFHESIKETSLVNPKSVMIEYNNSEVSENNYTAMFRFLEDENELEKKIFINITIFTTIFSLVLLVFLRRLKKLTHGAEDNEV